MRFTASKKSRYQSAGIFTAALVGVTTVIAAISSGCGPNDVIIHDCPHGENADGECCVVDVDGGSGGSGGNSGSSSSSCN